MIPHLADLIVPDDAYPHVEADTADQTGVYAWPAGDRLARDLLQLVDCTGLRVLDLGCGRGHLGLSALRLGAERVTFCDGHPLVCAGLRRVLEANRLTAAVHEHRWGTPPPGGPFDLILGGDILYRATLFPALLDSVAAAIGDGQVLLSDPRLRLEADLPRLAAERHLTWQQERQADYSLVRIRPRPGVRRPTSDAG